MLAAVMGQQRDYASKGETMADTFTEVTTTSWAGRLGGAFKGILVGLVLFAGSFVLLFWNEGRAVDRAKALAQGRQDVVAATADKLDPANEGKLVHMIGLPQTSEVLRDDMFDVGRQGALRLEREVKHYQWVQETKSTTTKKLGGGEETVTEYSYRKAWVGEPVDSSKFAKQGYTNPPAALTSRKFDAREVAIGAFRLNSTQIASLGNFQPVAISPQQVQALNGAAASRPSSGPAGPEAAAPVAPAAMAVATACPFAGKCKATGGGIYIGADPAKPELGDMQVSFKAAEPAKVSLVARQTGNTFAAYKTKTGSIDLFSMGECDADEMFKSAERSNTLVTWLLRLAGVVAMNIGVGLILAPLRVLADVVPFIGSIVGFGLGLIAAAISLPLSLLTIAAAWVWYRPVVGIVLLALGLSAGAAIFMLARRRKRAKAAAAQAASA
jgi:hypothetical protein